MVKLTMKALTPLALLGTSQDRHRPKEQSKEQLTPTWAGYHCSFSALGLTEFQRQQVYLSSRLYSVKAPAPSCVPPSHQHLLG